MRANQNPINIQIEKTRALITQKQQELDKSYNSIAGRHVYHLFHADKPLLQIKCLKKLLTLLEELQNNFENKEKICTQIINLALGHREFKKQFYVSKYHPTEYAALEGIYCYVPPENTYLDRTAKRFRDARQTVKALKEKNPHNIELSKLTSVS